jgi:hypothetical protein
MRDEVAKWLTFVNTWIDGVPSNLDKSLAKWRMSFESKKKNRGENREMRAPSTGCGGSTLYRNSLVPARVTNWY